MPQSLVLNYIHIVFSTKNRHPFIDENIRDELFTYLAGICNYLDCCPIIVGGYKDHVHILCTLSRKIPLMRLIEELKTSSSKWIKTKGIQYRRFYWQNGYGTFSVGYKHVDIVKKYISNQEEHHSKNFFKDEYRSLLTEYDMEHDERYMWD